MLLVYSKVRAHCEKILCANFQTDRDNFKS